MWLVECRFMPVPSESKLSRQERMNLAQFFFTKVEIRCIRLISLYNYLRWGCWKKVSSLNKLYSAHQSPSVQRQKFICWKSETEHLNIHSVKKVCVHFSPTDGNIKKKKIIIISIKLLLVFCVIRLNERVGMGFEARRVNVAGHCPLHCSNLGNSNFPIFLITIFVG